MIGFIIISILRAVPMAILGVMLFMFTPDCAEFGKFTSGIEAKGITQQKIADLLGLGWNATHAKLTGERPFTLQEAVILADFIGCSLDWLTGRDSDQ